MMDKMAKTKGESIRHFYYQGPLSCSELSSHLHKSLPYATRLISELMEEGCVQEMGYASSTGGRRPLTYALLNDAFYIVSVAMDQFLTRVAVLDLNNQPICPEQEFALDLSGNPKSLEQLGDLLSAYITNCGIPHKKLAGIGIGMPGFIDISKGINHSFLPAPAGQTVVSYLKSRTQLPVHIDNDSSLIALAESKFGQGKEGQHCLIVNIGWGVGLGIVLNGHLYRGNNGFAGEFSHIPLFTNNKMCSCGKLGCLETESSLAILVAKAREGRHSGIATALPDLEGRSLQASIDLIIKAALNGDRFVLELIGEIGYNIGRGIAILIHVLNPSHVVLSGRGAAMGNLWLPSVQKAINEHCIPRIAEKATFSVSTLGKAAELVGGACLVMEHIQQFYNKPIQRTVTRIPAAV
ncbi:MAG TPA: ROK family protein [Phnomibacter sp.]|nr:ROK family protein [Phnomibacter sp.]